MIEKLNYTLPILTITELDESEDVLLASNPNDNDFTDDGNVHF